MNANGSNIRTLSFHETNEWFPTVAPSGHVLYSRWDYVDRHPVLHQNLWACRPDGTNPVALWGNHTETPHCTFQLQPIPGTSKVVFTASAHHSITGGSIAIVDTRLGNNGEHALTGANDPSALGIYLLDRWGNRELLYRDPEIGSSNPIPLVPRPVPPILPDLTADGDHPPGGTGLRPVMSTGGTPVPPTPVPHSSTGEMVLLDVYEGLGDVPRGSVKALRIVQILPKTTPVADGPRIGLAGQEPARALLGTVPVEPDGSARFTLPARTPVFFQALDADGFAIQSMRSITYAQPGERATCIGCHEHRMTAPPSRLAQALLRPPSPIAPGPDGTKPFSYVRLVQPILDKHCVKCHSTVGGASLPRIPPKGLDLTGTPHDRFTRSYWSLCGGLSFWHGGTNAKNAAEALVPRYGGWNPVHRTEPGGAYGARGSRLMKTLLKRQGERKLPPDDGAERVHRGHRRVVAPLPSPRVVPLARAVHAHHPEHVRRGQAVVEELGQERAVGEDDEGHVEHLSRDLEEVAVQEGLAARDHGHGHAQLAGLGEEAEREGQGHVLLRVALGVAVPAPVVALARDGQEQDGGDVEPPLGSRLGPEALAPRHPGEPSGHQLQHLGPHGRAGEQAAPKLLGHILAERLRGFQRAPDTLENVEHGG